MTAATFDSKSCGIEIKATGDFATEPLMLCRDGDGCIHQRVIEAMRGDTDADKPLLVRGNVVTADAKIDSVEKEVEGADKPFLTQGNSRSSDIKISVVGEDNPRNARCQRSDAVILNGDELPVESAGLEMVDVDILHHESTAEFKLQYTAEGALWVTDRLRKERQVMNSFLETRHDALAHDIESIFFKAHRDSLAGRKLIEESCAAAKLVDIPHSSVCAHAATQDNHTVVPLRDTDTFYVSGHESEARGIEPAIYGNNETSDVFDDSFEHEKMFHEGGGDKSASMPLQSHFIEESARRNSRMSRNSRNSALVRPGLKEDIKNVAAAVDRGETEKSEYVSPASHERVLLSGMGMRFELFFGFLIIFNAVVMAFRLQYDSFNLATDLGIRESASSDTWPGAGVVFDWVEHVIGGLFCMELLARLFRLKARFFRHAWHLFDVIVVFCWFAGMLRNIHFKPLILRMVKLMRLARLLRIVRFITIFDPLHLLVKSVVSSITLLVWSLALLLFIIMVTAMVVNQFLDEFHWDQSIQIDKRLEVFRQWGSMSRALETVFEITLGNWGPPCRLLQNTVNEWWVLFFITYKCLIGFAVVQVITSVFIQQTFKVAARDEQVMINEKKAQVSAYLKNLESLFSVLDYTGDGFITFAELETCLQDTTVRAWFSALEVDVQETEHLFSLLDFDQDGSICRLEFIQGIKQLRGPARSIDVMCLNKIMRRVEKFVRAELGGRRRNNQSWTKDTMLECHTI
eukprot:TRINITY_DN4454_c0_g1_i3.p1 TRINITY_DN4454_c0_g1~~TRINITY_DN4454_c0_g1_i3.p1  ORF type:complete len:760 (+),score=114.68 TRINITY_DN4454_c0_g1_i3:48-2282(+)